MSERERVEYSVSSHLSGDECFVAAGLVLIAEQGSVRANRRLAAFALRRWMAHMNASPGRAPSRGGRRPQDVAESRH